MPLLFALMVFFISFIVQATPLEFQNATVRQPLPGKNLSAGYFSVLNSSDKTITLVAASSPWFERVELHQHSMHNGMMRMEKVDSFEIQAGEQLHLQPGGLHLMLFAPKNELTLGAIVPIQVSTADGQQWQISAVVTKIPTQ